MGYFYQIKIETVPGEVIRVYTNLENQEKSGNFKGQVIFSPIQMACTCGNTENTKAWLISIQLKYCVKH
jgi:hypothetical protein